MAGPRPTILFGIPSASADAHYYPRYPLGDKFSGSAVGAGVTANSSAPTGGGALPGFASGAVASASTSAPAGSGGQTSAQDVTTFAMEGSGTQWVTFGQPFRQGDVPVGTVPVITNAGNSPISTSQSNILATWPDGSVRHAAMHAQLTGGTSYKIRTGTQSGVNKTVADLLAAVSGDIARVDFTGGITGSAILSNLLSSATNRAPGGLKIIAGPQVLDVVVSQDFSTHIRLTFHLRWYGGSLLWCDYIFENGYGNVNGLADKTYSATCILNGSTVKTISSLVHFNRTMHHCGFGFWTSGGTLYAHHSVPYLRDYVCIAPNYDKAYPPSNAFLNTLPQVPPAPLQRVAGYPRGDFPASTWQLCPWGPDQNDANDIESTGYQETIGILPRWDALYVTSGGDIRAYKSMITMHDGCMVAPIPMMSSTDGEHMRVSDYPSVTISGGTGYGSGAFTTANPVGAFRTQWAASHAPSSGFMPYALTANYAYLRQMTGWASEHTMWWTNNYNVSYGGMTVRKMNDLQQRGLGWAFRTAAQAAYILPDAHPSKTYYANVVNANFDALYADYVTPGTRKPGGLGCLHEYNWDTGSYDYAAFGHAFLTATLAYVVCDLQFNRTQAVEFAKYCGQFIGGVARNTMTFPIEFMPVYTYRVGAAYGSYYSTWSQFTTDTANLPTGAQALAPGSQAMATYLAANYSGQNHSGARYEPLGDAGSVTYWFANFQPAVAALEQLGIVGGAQSWDRLALSPRWPDYTPTPTFSIVPRQPLPPAWRPAQGVIAAISLNHISDVGVSSETTNPPNTNGAGNDSPWHGSLGIRALWAAWSGHAFVRDYGKYGGQVAFGGGHMGWYGNDMYVFPLDTLRWTRLTDPTYPYSDNQSEAEGAFGVPSAAHTQSHLLGLPASMQDGSTGPGLFVRVASSSSYQTGGGGQGRVHAANLALATPTWSRYSTNQDVNTSAAGNETSIEVYDFTRERIWKFNRTSPIQYLDRKSPTWVSTGKNTSDTVVIGLYPMACYIPGKDWIVLVDQYANANQLWVFDCSNPSAGLVQRTCTGTFPVGAGGPMTWINELKKVASMDTVGGTRTVKYLTCPAVITGAFNWTSETFTGPTPSLCDADGGPMFNKLHWSPKAKVLVLSTQHADSVYALTPTGT